MTFDDDLLMLDGTSGQVNISCRAAGHEWPPPTILFDVLGEPLPDGAMVCVSRSEMSDATRGELTHVFRAAVYRPQAAVTCSLHQPCAECLKEGESCE